MIEHVNIKEYYSSTWRMDMSKYRFNGKLNEKEMTGDVKRAYVSWRHQNERCNNKNCHGYVWYGAKGIKVEYSSRDFINWYINESKKIDISNPVVSRIDHSKNYCFSNITLSSVEDNSKEMAHRTQNIRDIVCVNMSNGYPVGIYRTYKEASEKSQFSIGVIQGCCEKKRYGTKKGITFRFIDDWMKEKENWINPKSKYKNHNIRSVICFNWETMKKIKEYESLKIASNETDVHVKNIIDMCKGRQIKTYSGITFRYKDEIT